MMNDEIPARAAASAGLPLAGQSLDPHSSRAQGAGAQLCLWLCAA